MPANTHTQKLLNDMKNHRAMAFSNSVMKIMDRFVAPACKAEARSVLTNLAKEYGLEIRTIRDPSKLPGGRNLITPRVARRISKKAAAGV